MQKVITSLQNPRVKQIVKLGQRRNRDVAQETVFEGLRETYLALKNDFTPTELFICHEIIGEQALLELMTLVDALPLTPAIYKVSQAVYAKMAYRESTGGVLAVLPYWSTSLAALSVSKRPFFAVVEDVEKPGNLGAILRTTDAVGVDGVIICSNNRDQSFDLYNPNVIRASLGAIFTQPIVVTTTKAFIDWAKQHKLKIMAATPEGKMAHTAVNLTQPIAIATGSEAFGLSNRLLEAADETAVIPMHGQLDSLNLSVSTALLLYEAHRQRQTVLNK